MSDGSPALASPHGDLPHRLRRPRLAGPGRVSFGIQPLGNRREAQPKAETSQGAAPVGSAMAQSLKDRAIVTQSFRLA
jgi:hypothetical protein